MNLFVLAICSSFILARLMAFFNVLGLNIRIPSVISDFNPPMKVPMREPFVSNLELDCLTSQTLFGTHEGI